MTIGNDVPESDEKTGQRNGTAQGALPRSVHIAVPAVSFLILLVFALTLRLPNNTGAFPVQTTILFVPIYVLVIVTVVFGSLYLFKNFVDKDSSSAGH